MESTKRKKKKQAIAPEVKRNHSVPFPCACHGVFVTSSTFLWTAVPRPLRGWKASLKLTVNSRACLCALAVQDKKVAYNVFPHGEINGSSFLCGHDRCINRVWSHPSSFFQYQPKGLFIPSMNTHQMKWKRFSDEIDYQKQVKCP